MAKKSLLVCFLALTIFAPILAKAQIEQEFAETQSSESTAVESASAEQQPPAFTPVPVSNLTAFDTPDDGGGSITLKWESPPKDAAKFLIRYEILRSESPDGKYEQVGIVSRTDSTYVDSNVKDKKDYWYKVVAAYAVDTNALFAESAPFGPVQSKAQWFDRRKIYFGFIAILISAAIIYYIEVIKAGKKPFIRKIAGLEAIDEAIGRATEMGKPIIFVPGIMDMNDVQTIAAIIVLGRVAKTIAEYDAKLLVPTSKSLVMTTARETVKEAYTAAGRPDAYSDDIVTYLTDEQFGYVAGVNGIMVREKPATCIYLGSFYAESLILAEVGNSIGAIQIAGTAQPAQLPFFIAACDYTLIGEELFAASAYLSQEPRQLGSLKGQDVGKGIAMIFILIGTIAATIATFGVSWAQWIVDFLMEKVFAAL